jgi:hypothetical protein
MRALTAGDWVRPGPVSILCEQRWLRSLRQRRLPHERVNRFNSVWLIGATERIMC